MSSVSSISSGLDWISGLQALSGQDTSNTASQASILDGGQDGDQTQAAQPIGGHHHHHHGIPSQIESAVTQALQNLKPGDDPNQAIQDAIATQLKGAAGARQDGSADGAPTGAPPAQDGSDSTGSTSQADFEALLKSFNVDPQQFKQDFHAAVQDVGNGGSVDFAKLFQSFPPGSAVDTTA